MYANGGLSIDTLIEEHGFDPEKEREKLKSQKPDVQNRVYSPAFEQKQGIVADTLGINKDKGDTPTDKGVGKKANGRPKKVGSKPQSETSTPNMPRPNVKSKA